MLSCPWGMPRWGGSPRVGRPLMSKPKLTSWVHQSSLPPATVPKAPRSSGHSLSSSPRWLSELFAFESFMPPLLGTNRDQGHRQGLGCS